MTEEEKNISDNQRPGQPFLISNCSVDTMLLQETLKNICGEIGDWACTGYEEGENVDTFQSEKLT